MKLQLILYSLVASLGIFISSYYFFFNTENDIKRIVNIDNEDNLKVENNSNIIKEKNILEKKTIKQPIIEVFRVEPNGQFVIA